MAEDVIETGRISNVLLRTICLPENETAPGSYCVTSGFNRNSKIIDAVPLNLLNQNVCRTNNFYNVFGNEINENQLCAGIPSKTNSTISVSDKYQEDFGGPLICLDKTSQRPILTGIAAFNSLSRKHGQPGMNQSVLRIFSFKLPENELFTLNSPRTLAKPIHQGHRGFLK